VKANLTLFLVTIFTLVCLYTSAQELKSDASVSVYSGIVNYEGDLKPNSFTFSHSNFFAGVIYRKKLNRWFTWRIAFSQGKLEGADKYNRNYLRPRNLSFYTSVTEAYTALSVTVLDLSVKRFTPYLYGGIGIFHFNPWTKDADGKKVYLQPLSTEGQGLPEYPDRKVYHLTQWMMPFGLGFKYMVSENFSAALELSQRKTFTDYIDDVSTRYVDENVLLNAKGLKAVELAYRGDEVPGGAMNSHTGDIRGTPSEMDWYYFLGVVLEVKLSTVKDFFSFRDKSTNWYYRKCPKF